MRRSAIYLENSIFGFYFDEKPVNIAKMQSTKTLFEQVKSRMFSAFTSPLTVKELSASQGPFKEKLLALIKDCQVEVVNVEENELEALVEKYMTENVVPEKFVNDARHVAYATILSVDILVSLNLEHIVNEWSVRKFNAVNLKAGYPTLIIRTPEETIHYEN